MSLLAKIDEDFCSREKCPDNLSHWPSTRKKADADKIVDTGKEVAAARSVACLSTVVEFYRGSRVEDYEPLFQLSAQVSDAKFLSLVENQQQAYSGDSSLLVQIVRFLAALLAGHGQKVGFDWLLITIIWAPLAHFPNLPVSVISFNVCSLFVTAYFAKLQYELFLTKCTHGCFFSCWR